MTRSPGKAPERAKPANRWLPLATVVPWGLTLVTAGVGIVQFTTQQAQANKRPFLEEQLKLSLEAVDAASTIATTTDETKWRTAYGDFWRLYYGKLAFVEDPVLAGAMGEFRSQLDGVCQPTDGGPPNRDGACATPELPAADLQNAARDIARAARELMVKSWKADITALDPEAPKAPWRPFGR